LMITARIAVLEGSSETGGYTGTMTNGRIWRARCDCKIMVT
jgi:hypothetical protein